MHYSITMTTVITNHRFIFFHEVQIALPAGDHKPTLACYVDTLITISKKGAGLAEAV
jgi:hypothetical protein